MPVCLKGRGHSRAVQASRTTAVFLACLLAGCADPLAAPVDLFHDLEGGEIAAQRPPPPGAGLPYPQLGSVPAQPTLPNPAYRNGLQAQLTAERDRTERTAADTKLATLPPPPAAAPPPPPAAAPPAAASLDTAESPPPPARVVPALPPPPTALVIEGAPAFIAGVPDMPAAPPPPAAFEGVPAEPLPTPRILPAGLAVTLPGTHVYFADASAVLPASQTQALRDFLSHRRHQPVAITGLGGAAADSPDGQATAIDLALRRARAVAAALEAQHVPSGAIRIAAQAFGQGAVLQLQ